MMKSQKAGISILVAAVLMMITSCSSSSSNNDIQAATTSISGSVFAAPVSGAAVTIKDANNITIANTTTNADGTYTVTIATSALSADLTIVSSGGTFSDETTGDNTTGGTLAAFVSGGTITASSAQVHLDPSSTIIYHLVKTHGKTLADASSAFLNAFGYTPDSSVAPALSTASFTGSDSSQRFKGLIAAAFSQMTSDLVLTPDKQFALFEALAQDLSDDMLDGMNGMATPVTFATTTMPTDILTIFSKALETVSKTAITTSYKVVYSYPMGMTMGATKGKTTFKLKITDPTGTTPITGLVASEQLMLMPMMHMTDGMAHATPQSTIIDNGSGNYTCTLYYLMPSTMSGMSMGYWELQVMIGDMMGGMAESAYIYPSVGMFMPMTDTPYSKLTGTDTIMGSMGMPESRNYYIFNDGLVSGATNSGLNLFIAAKESMDSYPALSTLATTTLHDEHGAAWSIASISVAATMDNNNWGSAVLATETTTGHWSIPETLGLVTDSTNTVFIQLTVNGEIKTSGTATYATFTVTP